MYYLRKIVMLLSASLVFGNAERGISQDSVAPLYINDFGREMLCDVPWVVNKDEPIPFFFLIKDCDQHTLSEFHGLAIYDISNGVKYYSNGTRLIPLLNDTTWGFWFQDTIWVEIWKLRYPPLKPHPLYRDSVPNQLFYLDYKDMGYSEPPTITLNWWKREENTFKHVGKNWSSSLEGSYLTPSNLGYAPGDTITFRAIIIGTVIGHIPNTPYLTEVPIYHEQDFRVIVSGEMSPLPKIVNWYLTDCHTHSWNTDNEVEYGGITPFMAKAAKKIGLDCLILTDHSNDCGWVQDHNDGWGSGTNWNHCSWEVNQYAEVLLIRGEEISGRIIGGNGKVVTDERHFLGFSLNSYIEGWHPLTVGYPGALYDVNAIMSGQPNNNPSNNITAQNGFSYMAHPADYYEFEFAGHTYHDSTTLLDALKHRVCRGLQIFNCRKTHKSNSEWHPWGEFPYGQTWEESHPDWFDIYIPIIRIWDRYMAKHLDSLRKKVFVLGGSDAHGDFNYAIAKEWYGPWKAEATTLGAWRTAVYCPTGLTRDNILNGLKMGRSVVTDGPMLIFGLDMNNDGDIYDAGDLMKMKKYFSGLDGWFSFIIIVC